MSIADLPFIDEHCADIAASPDAAVDAVLSTFDRRLHGGVFARLLGCEPSTSSGWDDAAVGASVPGFRIEEIDRPRRLVLAGRHRFARYAIVVRISPTTEGSRCCLESRASFGGLHGRLYRAMVVSSRLHVIAVRRLLAEVAQSSNFP